MPTITGSRQGGSTGPYLTLQWDVLQTDVANNRSRVRLILYLNASHRVNFSATKSGVLQGSSFSYTRGASGTGSWELRRQEIWVNHNSDGSKTQNFSGSFNIAITYSGTYISSLSVSGNATLPVIPRASTLSAFSFASHLKPSTAVNINYTVDRKSDAFRHQIQLRDGSHVVQTWDNVSSNGSSTVQLSTASVNSLLNRMSNVTSRSLTLRVSTRSGVGGGWIGSAVTRSATATVDASVKPSISALSLSQTGNSVSTHYLQGISKITASFTRSAGYGASISSSSITVRRKGNNDDVQTINSNSGTTGRAIAHSGTYQAQGMARDSRGRTTYTAWTDFQVTAYDSPRITNFTANRSSSTPTTVSIARAGTHTPLGGSNILTYTVQRRLGAGAWTNVDTNATGTSATSSFSGTSTSTGNAVTSSYDFRIVVTDKFGESAESIITVSTQRVVLDIHKNEGVGIGKIHERGVLDVDGSAYFKGDVEFLGGLISTMPAVSATVPLTNYPLGISMFTSGSNERNGFPDGYHTAVNFHGSAYRNGQLVFDHNGRNLYFRGYRSDNGWSGFTKVAGVESGSNSNGYWVRFNDGTQICWHRWTNNNTSSHSDGNGMWRSGHISKTHAQSFTAIPSVSMSALGDWRTWIGPDSVSTTSCNGVIWRAGGAISSTQIIDYMAVGRWK